jgi:hypothetical protein
VITDHSVESSLEKRANEQDESNKNQQNVQQPIDPELARLFYLNTTTGYLFTTSTDMPCSDCIIHIQYKANDVGRSKTRVSRKSSIKLHIKPFPTALFKANGDHIDHLVSDSADSAVELSPLKTFDLVLPNKTDQRIVINLNEDVKLGEKVYQLKTKPIGGSQDSSTIVYYTLLVSLFHLKSMSWKFFLKFVSI